MNNQAMQIHECIDRALMQSSISHTKTVYRYVDSKITLNQFLHGPSLMAKHLLNHEQTMTPCLSGNASDVGKICATSCCTDITIQLYKGIPT